MTFSGRVRPGAFLAGASSRVAPLVLALGILPVAAASEPAIDEPRRVAVLVDDVDDERVAMVDDAVSFWNAAVSDLGLAGPFSEPGHETPPVGLRPFENYAHQLSQLAGRLHSSDPGPAPPEALFLVDAEVVVLLSAQNLMPFAWPYGDDGRYLVAIPAGDERDNVVRNVIAHELGHVLGLKHLREPGVLMCQPCDTSAGSDSQPRFLPLTDLDRERLRNFLGGPDHDVHLDP